MPQQLQAADAHRAELARITAAVLVGVRRLWKALGVGDFDQSWAALSPQVLALLMAGQLSAAREAIAYVPNVLAELNIPDDPVAVVNPRSVVGVAGSGVRLDALLAQPVITTRVGLADGLPMEAAQAAGGKLLGGIVQTQIVDASRAIESVETVVRPAIHGYVRHLSLPSCDRCAVLAGKFFRWNTGFSRHLHCDCFHVATTEQVADDLTTDPVAAIKAGQVHGLSEADMKTIVDDGADPGRVINAKRGMSTAQVFGQRAKVTTTNVGTSPIRLRPETLYQLAGDDRLEAVRLLHQFGYLL